MKSINKSIKCSVHMYQFKLSSHIHTAHYTKDEMAGNKPALERGGKGRKWSIAHRTEEWQEGGDETWSETAERRRCRYQTTDQRDGSYCQCWVDDCSMFLAVETSTLCFPPTHEDSINLASQVILIKSDVNRRHWLCLLHRVTLGKSEDSF